MVGGDILVHQDEKNSIIFPKPAPLNPNTPVVVNMNVHGDLSAYPGTLIRQDGDICYVLCLDDNTNHQVQRAFIFTVEEYNLVVNQYDQILYDMDSSSRPIQQIHTLAPVQDNIVRICISPIDENDNSWAALRHVYVNTKTFTLYANAYETGARGGGLEQVTLMGFNYNPLTIKWEPKTKEPTKKKKQKTEHLVNNCYSLYVTIHGVDSQISQISQQKAANLVQLWNYNYDEKKMLNRTNCGPLLQASWDILKRDNWIHTFQKYPRTDLGYWIVYKGDKKACHYFGATAQEKLFVKIITSLQSEENKEFLDSLVNNDKINIQALTQFEDALQAKIDHEEST